MHVIHVPLENANFDWMWIWWLGTVVLCLWKIIEAVVFRPVRLLEWPFMACTMWLYFFGYMAYKAKMTLSAYLGNGMANIGQLMDFLCLIGLLAGWSAAMRLQVKWTVKQRPVYPYLLCWLTGFGLVVLGAIGSYSVVQAGEEGDLNFQTASAYWYLLYYIGYPGLAIAMWAALKFKPPLSYILMGVTFAALVVFLYPYLAGARRGPVFPAIILVLLVPPLTLRRPPNRLLYCGGLIGVGVFMLLCLQIRTTIYSGGTWSEALQKLNVEDAVVERGDEAYDNEYINNCQVIATVNDSGKYEYGTGHLGLFLHWVPRAFWPDKPVLGQGVYYSDKERFDDIEKITGVSLLGFGASTAGVAESFVEYGYLCPLFWFLLAFGIGFVYLKAVRSGSPWWLFSYVGFLCSTHWLISQGFAPAFVPGMYFQLVPLGVLVMVGLYRRLTAAPYKSGRRRPLPVPAGAHLVDS